MTTLEAIGLDCSYETVRSKQLVAAPNFALQDSLALQTLTFALRVVFHRCSSLGWHSHNWPGKLAMLLDPAKRDDCIRELRLDYRAFLEAEQRCSGSTLLGKMVISSPFQTEVWKRLDGGIVHGGIVKRYICKIYLFVYYS